MLPQVVEIKPEWPKGYSRLGAAAIGMGDTERAKAAYEKGVPFSEREFCMQLYLAQFIASCLALGKVMEAMLASRLVLYYAAHLASAQRCRGTEGRKYHPASRALSHGLRLRQPARCF